MLREFGHLKSADTLRLVALIPQRQTNGGRYLAALRGDESR
jgi:hypothetical protein